MAKISIDTIQPSGASLLADDESFINDLSEYEMQVSGGGKSKLPLPLPLPYQAPQPALGFVLHPFGWDVAVFFNQGGYGGVPVAVTIARGGGSPIPAFPGTSYPSGLGAGSGLIGGYNQLW
jgi:hypothetical protein